MPERTVAGHDVPERRGRDAAADGEGATALRTLGAASLRPRGGGQDQEGRMAQVAHGDVFLLPATV